MIEILITSAVTASLTSGLIALIEGWRNRASRRKEKLFEHSLQMARERIEDARRTGKGFVLVDSIFLAETYYRWLVHFYETGEVPPDAKQTDGAKHLAKEMAEVRKN